MSKEKLNNLSEVTAGWKKYLKSNCVNKVKVESLQLTRLDNVKITVFELDNTDYEIITSRRTENNKTKLYAYLRKKGYALVQDLWGTILGDNEGETYDSWLELVLSNIDDDIAYYESICDGE